MGKLKLAAVLVLLAGPACAAQATVYYTSGNNQIPVSAANPLPVTGGGGGGGAVTVADGADVTQGALADAACATDNGSCSVAALIKRNNQRLTTLLAGIPTTGAAASGAAVSGNPVLVAGTDGTNARALLTDTAGRLKIDGPYTPGSTAPTSAVGVVGASDGTNGRLLHTDTNGNLGLGAQTTGGCTPYGYQSAASTNSTSVKAAAGTLCGGFVINTTATLYYLRLYDLAAGPTCSSATGFITTIPVPASATGAGTLVSLGPYGAAFATGIAFCLTGGGTSTDNTNAATGVFVTLSYK